MGWTKRGWTIFKSDIMIVYKRKLKKEDVQHLDDDEELIYYYNNNVAYTIIQVENRYAVRKKKVFNNQVIEEKI